MASLYWELPGSPVETLGDEAPVASRQVGCLWGDRYVVYASLIGTAYNYHTTTILIAKSITISPFDSKANEVTPGDSTKQYWDQAILDITYEVLQGGQRDQANPGGTNPMKMRSFEEAIDGNAEFTTVNGQDFWWNKYSATKSEQSKKLDNKEAPAHIAFNFDWVCSYVDVLVLPDFGPLIGKVNDAEVTSQTLGYTFAAETLLFHPPTMRRTVTEVGTTGWNLIVSFSFKEDTWNKFYFPGWEEYKASESAYQAMTGPWQRISKDKTTTGYFNVYETEDFSEIIPPPDDP